MNTVISARPMVSAAVVAATRCGLRRALAAARRTVGPASLPGSPPSVRPAACKDRGDTGADHGREVRHQLSHRSSITLRGAPYQRDEGVVSVVQGKTLLDHLTPSLLSRNS